MVESSRVAYLALGLFVALLAALSSGCVEAEEILIPPSESPPADPNRPKAGAAINVAGGWDVSVNETLDTCGIDLPAGVREIFRVDQRGLALALGVSDGSQECGDYSLDLQGNSATLDRATTVTEDDGCTTAVETTFTLRFAQTTFTATEQNRLTYLSGDCGGFTGSCDWNLEATASRCETCGLSCAGTFPPGRDRLGGPLGFAAQIDVSVR
jgi:hypothetical protein